MDRATGSVPPRRPFSVIGLSTDRSGHDLLDPRAFMFHLTFALPALYVLARFVWPLPWAPGGKIALAIAVLVASQYHLWSRLSSGSVFSPEFPRALVLMFNWAFGAIALLAVMQITLDVTALIVRLVRSGGT